MFPDIGHMYGGQLLSIKNKIKEKKEKKIIKNNKKNIKQKFFTLKLKTVYKKLKLKMFVGPLLPK